MSKIVVKQTHFEPIPVGEYVAKIGNVEEEEGQFGPQLRIEFTLDKEGRTLIGWASRTFSPKSKLYAWSRAAFGGRAIPLDWDFDSDAILGRTVRLVVITQTKADTGEEYNRITDVKPARAGDVLPQAIRAKEPEPPEPEPQEAEIPF